MSDRRAGAKRIGRSMVRFAVGALGAIGTLLPMVLADRSGVAADTAIVDSGPDTPALTAIRANGDAVYITARGRQIALWDREPLYASMGDTVTITPNRERAWVTTCCEPVWGHWWEIRVCTGEISDFPGQGHGFDLSPTGRRLASLGYYELAVRDRTGEILVRQNLLDELAPRDPYRVIWLDHRRLAVLEFVQPESGNEFRLVTTDSSLSGYTDAAGTVIATDFEAPWPELAGVGPDGSVLVFQGMAGGARPTARVLHAYHPDTLDRRRGSDIRLPARAVHAWMQDGKLLWIDTAERLRVDDRIVPGRFQWARTA